MARSDRDQLARPTPPAEDAVSWSGRSPLEELRAYPFFAPEDDAPAPPWLARHGLALLVALAIVLAVELALLAYLTIGG